MKRKSTGPTTRDVVNHHNGKGDKTRVTDVQAYRENFSAIDWSSKKKGMTLQALYDKWEYIPGVLDGPDNL